MKKEGDSKKSMYTSNLQKTARISGQYGQVLKNLTKCVFCDLREKYIIDKIDHVVLSVNLFPYTNGQLIIIPERHVEKLAELTDQEWVAVKSLINKSLKLLKSTYDISDVNVIYREGDRCETCGKTVAHFHVNIIPFKNDLMTWNYQEITEEPLEVAKKLRQHTSVSVILGAVASTEPEDP